jgi:hypothetical protein
MSVAYTQKIVTICLGGCICWIWWGLSKLKQKVCLLHMFTKKIVTIYLVAAYGRFGGGLSQLKQKVCLLHMHTKDSDYLFRWLHMLDLVVLATGLVNKLATWVSLYIQKPWL